jgi:hypothetical protein
MNRKYLMGLGSGLIAGALLMQLMYLGQTPPTTSTAASLPPDWKDRVADMGYFLYTKEEMKQKTNKPVALDSNAQAPNIVDKNKDNIKLKQATVYIPSGYKSIQVVELLMKAGIIEDAAKLQQMLDTNGLSRKIQVGTYTFAIPSTVEEVSKTITNSP